MRSPDDAVLKGVSEGQAQLDPDGFDTEKMRMEVEAISNVIKWIKAILYSTGRIWPW